VPLDGAEEVPSGRVGPPNRSPLRDSSLRYEPNVKLPGNIQPLPDAASAWPLKCRNCYVLIL